MALMVVTTDPSKAGQEVVAVHRKTGAKHTSYFDSHGKARIRGLFRGDYQVQVGNKMHKIEVKDSAISLGYSNLIAEDREYLDWLELPAKDKEKAIVENLPIAKWALGVKVSR